MIPSLSPQQLQAACTALSSAALIRLVSEIDDHGAIPPRELARTLTDLTPHQIRQAIEQADALGLLDRSSCGLGLTAEGGDLADVYDATARWARRHNQPAPICDFAGRIRHTFALLGEPAAVDPRTTGGEAAAGLGRVHRLLAEWIHAHPSQQIRGAYGVAA
ncbi:regulator [Streptomyces ureilyticus]|uniref:Regulator n=1 Tax=Streptomyces ureilyticus TaxID=1775131 RepID=A0ABX0E8E8_9ACTN|nr:regulator [Streptomyces ureilyticus]NGO49264.1 regulator [Streptomyces ureilyticus]